MTSAIYRSGPYQAWLRRRPPDAIAWTPSPLHVGSASRANEMFQGRYTFAGHTVQSAREAPWRRDEISPDWLQACNEFGWLADFAAADGPTARKQARELVRRWIADFGTWAPLEWASETLGRRVLAWLTFADTLLIDAEPDFTPTFLRALGEQVRHLGRIQGSHPSATARAIARASYLAGNIALGRRVSAWDRALTRTLSDVEHVTNGGATRNPQDYLRVLEALLCLRDAMTANRLAESARLTTAIESLSAALRTVTHGDGRLAVFGGGREGDSERIAAIVSRHAPRTAPINAPGFARLQQSRLLVIAETSHVGSAIEPFLSAHAFEVSVGKERLFVNCGRPDSDDPAWQAAARATAAHTALVIDDRNQDLPASDPDTPQVLRGEEGDSVWMELSSGTYTRRFGVRLSRRFHIAKDGYELVCEDQVIPSPTVDADTPTGVCARFHLHPRVHASPLGDNRQILLKLGNGTGWVFGLEDGTAQLEDSIYFGDAGRARRTRQIVVSRSIENRSARLMWHLMRMDGRT